MARKSILDFKGQNKLFSGMNEGWRGSGGGVVRLKAVLQRKNVARMDGRGTARPFIQATFFRLGFAVHRLGVSGLEKRREQGFRTVGGGCLYGGLLPEVDIRIDSLDIYGGPQYNVINI
ncbi:MAG: hypothetical protein E7450_05100 [Ruminococcaceae bacterium]|nr:hypothetical protein [Oscillospiraceae bacterium]